MDDDGSFRLTRSGAPYSKWSKIKAPSSFNTEELFLRLEEWLLAEEADSELGDGDSELLAESNLDLDNSGEESPELTVSVIIPLQTSSLFKLCFPMLVRTLRAWPVTDLAMPCHTPHLGLLVRQP